MKIFFHADINSRQVKIYQDLLKIKGKEA